MKKKLNVLLILISLPIIAILVFISWLTITDFNPDQVETAEITNINSVSSSDTLSIFNWNLGYGGLGEKMDFFMDGGSRVRAPETEYSVYWKGIKNFIEKSDNHIYFFQEMDRKSSRSYKEDQYQTVSGILGNYNSSFAPNYKVKFIPSPTIIGTQYGSVHSGLSIFSRFAIEKSTRISLPGNYKWPKKVLFLDRCMLVSEIRNRDGKKIILINTHKSAYDKGGFLKKEQLDFIKEYAEKEYSSGNYVVIGGDWNSYMPGTDGNSFPSEEVIPYFYQSLPEDWVMENWKWAVDPDVPTNRSLENAYEKGKTFTSVIDGFLLSPNIEILKVNTIDLGFRYSDHNPIEIRIQLQ